MYKHQALINGQLINNATVVKIINPDGLKVVGQVPALKAPDINEAYQSARNAQKNWEHQPLLKRIAILNVWKELIAKDAEKIATIMMSEIGKPYQEALTEVKRTIEYIDFTFEEAKRMNPLALTGTELGATNKYGIFEYIAKGVGLAISPFNYPINLAMSKIAPALVMGNTIVFKPATAGSLTGTYLGELSVKANLPTGIFNVVTGKGRDIGDHLTNNPELDFISFTGSVSVGQNLLKTASTKDVVLELGGKDPALVLDAENLEKYANEIIAGAFGYSGQRCTAIKRVITTNEIADQLAPLLTKKISALKVGAPKDNPIITPLVDQTAADFVLGLIKDAEKKGAKILIGNQHQANLIWPTLVDYVTSEMDLAWVEPFGPVLPIIRVNDVDEMVAIANQSNFGLQASVFSKDISLAIRVAQHLETGTININGRSQRGPDSFPFLGIKDSGFGVQGIHQTLLSVTRIRGIVLNY